MPPTKKDLSSEGESNHSFITVGLGASAGGISALKDFFAAMPADSGMAFVVILHLSPRHESNLPAILQSETKMPVTQVTEEVKVEPNHVYVIPPNKNLAMTDGHIKLTKTEKQQGPRVAIDLFFRTLADARGKNSVCIILSGTGSDGTLGLKQIKEREGFAIAQDPNDAEYDSMPRSAIATNLVDWILPVAEMPKKLIGFRDSSRQLNLTSNDAKAQVDLKGAENLQELLTLIRVRTGHDFSHYKQATLIRRIARHIQIYELEDIPSYIKLLREHPEDMQSLIKNLLINVTNFFRDREAFAAVEKEIIPRLFAGKTSKDTIRVWSAACASGEEAYSLGMLLSEYAGKLSDPPKLQVFATDVDEDAITEAREHRYPEAIEADVSQERLNEFFVRNDGYYRVKKSLREIILFAPHNILRDPPFSRLDMVSCRNLMIYLNRETQDRVLQIFHFALKHDGILFLGNSESAESQSNLYLPVDKKQRIYARRPSPPNLQKAPVLPLKGGDEWRVKIPDIPAPHGRPRLWSFGEIHYKLVEQYAPPSILVNEDFDIVHISEKAGRFLRFSGGEPSNNLLKAIHPDLLADLRAALFTTQREAVTTEQKNIPVRLNGDQTFVNLTVKQLNVSDAASNFLLVILDEVSTDAANAKAEQPVQVVKDNAMETVTRRLEDDLRRTKDRLRTTIEQHETSIEELKASNEELQAINEELRSASEELETSKEELQSLNEELTTVNHEHKEKIDELGRTNSDLQNFMAATNIGTIFLDRSLSIRRYTPAVQRLFNIIPTDVGRPLSHLTHRFGYAGLPKDAADVLNTLKTVERELHTTDGQWFAARLLPYRSVEDKIDGVTVNFVDITELKRAREHLQITEERMRLLVDSATDYAIFTTDPERLINSWSPGAKAMFGYTEKEIIGKTADILFTPEDRENGDPEREIVIAAKEGRAESERWHARKNGGSTLYGSGVVMPLRNDEGKDIGFVKIIRDLTDRRQTEQSLANLGAIIESSEDAIISKDLNGVITSWNLGAQHLFGYTAGEAVGQSVTMLIPEDRIDEEPYILERIRRGESVEHYETVRRRKDGTLLDISLTVSPIRDKTRRVVGASKIARDITIRKQVEEALRVADLQKDIFLATLAHELRNPLASIRSGIYIIKGKETEKSDFDRAVSIVERQTMQIVRLVDDLLDTSRVAQGKIRLKKEVIDLENVIDMAVEANRERINAKSQTLTVTKSEKPVFLEADSARLTQVILNLLINASKYTQSGGAIWLSSKVESGEVVIRIIDNGAGIASNRLVGIFNMFSQGEQDAAKREGLGVGLSLVKKLVELHDGTIEAFSDGDGKGSEFVVRLPISVPAGFDVEKAKEFLKPAEDVTVKPQRILVVDDNVDAAEMLSVLLRQEGHEVQIAYDAEEGIAEAEKFKPDTVLLDIGLPKIDGYEAAVRIRKKLPDVNLIAISGLGQYLDVKRSAEAGFDKHLVKPVEFEELRRVLAEAR